MKYIILFILVYAGLFARTQAQDTIQIMKDYELKSELFHYWDSIHELAEQTFVLPLFQKHGIEVSCASCESALITTMLVFDRSGKLTQMVITDYSLCDKPLYCDFEEVLRNYLMQVNFPAGFSNMHLISRFGRALKC